MLCLNCSAVSSVLPPKSHFPEIAQALRDLPPASKYHFFVSKWTNLGETPLEALKRGRVTEVLRAARGFATT